MDDIIQSYRKVEYALPEKIKTWFLYGAGLENFGKDKQPEIVPMPAYGPDELLVRVDAVGLCMSDIKVINQGNQHARLQGRDLATNPVTLGHEPAITVVGVGENLKDKYQVGQRLLVQADVFYKGTSMAFGYVLAGAQTQYQVLTKELLQGDEGAYILPLADSTGYAEGALTEAWSCVVASYRIKLRTSIKPGGRLWIVGSPDDDGNYTLDMDIPSATVFMTDINQPLKRYIEEAAEVNNFELIDTPQWDDLDINALEAEIGLFDDIIVLGNGTIVEAASKLLGKDGTLCIVATEPMDRPMRIDVGKVHYHNHSYIGTSTRSLADAYKPVRVPSELRPGGAAWFIGGAGPMGKMHVQLALEMENGPSRILITDVGNERLDAARSRFEPIAKAKGIELRAVNPMEMSKEEFVTLVDELTMESGFDDIVVMAPVAAIIADAVKYLAVEGLMNIFAGVPIGTIADMDLTGVYIDSIRFVGSSGSKLSDMADTLRAAETGQLSSGTALAAIGGMDASWDGMKAVKELTYTGKIVIFPQFDLELTALPDLKDKLPNVYAKLQDGEFWTNEAEEELLRTKLELG